MRACYRLYQTNLTAFLPANGLALFRNYTLFTKWLPAQLVNQLNQLEITQPTDVQEKAIPALLDGKDVMVTAKTGSGKTAAFLLPMMAKFLETPKPNAGTRALIMVPTRELAQQIEANIIAFSKMTNIKGLAISGGETYREQAAKIRKNPEILVTTPGRMVEHIQKKNVDFDDLEWLILDEADRMLDMGFGDDVTRILNNCPTTAQTGLFSATLGHAALGKIATTLLKDPIKFQINDERVAHDQIVQKVVLADDDKHKSKLAAKIIKDQDAKTIVFVNTRDKASVVANHLNYMGVDALYLHGELTQDQRNEITQKYRSRAKSVLVATDVAARGLDIDDVSLVINFDMARKADEYVHRIGRTGRAHQQGVAISLICDYEWNNKAKVEKFLGIRFQSMQVPGLSGKYKGPKKVKASGKIAGAKKRPKKTGAKIKKSKPKTNPKPKVSSDGFGMIKKRK